jgi:hypothetical protein
MTAPRAQRLQPTTPINIAALPGLQAALWDRHDRVIPAEELLHLYEDRWFYIDRQAMDAGEQALLERLINELGNGVFLD